MPRGPQRTRDMGPGMLGPGPHGYGAPGAAAYAAPGYPMHAMGPMMSMGTAPGSVAGYPAYNYASGNSMPTQMAQYGVATGTNYGMEQMQPGMSQYMQPGMSQYVQPGMSQYVQPGMYPGMQPGTTLYMQPGMQSGVQPAENQSAASQVHSGPSIIVFVGNIIDTASDDILQYILGKCGKVVGWKRAVSASGKPATFAFCEFADPEEALRAIRLLHDRPFAGQKLVVKADAKTKAQLEEYKASKKSDHYVDQKSQEKDRIAMKCIELFIMERESDLIQRKEGPILGPKGEVTKRDKPAPNFNGKVDEGKQSLEGLELEEETKILIEREIGKFKTTVVQWDKKQEREKRAQEELLESQRRRKDREKRHQRTSETDYEPPHSRSRSRERDEESENRKRLRDKEEKLKRMKEIEKELEQEEALERQKRERLLVQGKDEAAYQEDLTRQAVLSLFEQDHVSNPISEVLKDLLISTYLIPAK